MPFDFSQWPPSLSPDQIDVLHLRAARYALSHGLLYLPPGTQPSSGIPTSAIHAPFSLLPTPVPRAQFEHAKKIQSIYNVLYARIAMDTEFLDTVMGTERGVGKVDDFVGRLWNGWKKLRDAGLEQPLHLGLFRSDYLLHSEEDGLSLKQVEFNTISSSFGTLSQKVSGMHRHLYGTTQFFNSSSFFQPENFPPNDTTTGLAEGLAAAHKAYNVPGSYILFVVQPGERNVFDQLWLEYELLEKHSIPVIRCTLSELASRASVSAVNAPMFISPSSSSSSADQSRIEISTIYFRACYTPVDFIPSPSSSETLTEDKLYETRFLLEQSRAIKCPSIPLQLAGGKKVQEVLTRKGVVESFLCNPRWGKTYPEEQVQELRTSWMRMWGLDAPASAIEGEGGGTKDGLALAYENHLELVLKPQREGGGNNVYKEDIPKFLDTLQAKASSGEKAAWIAMELIRPPKDVGGYLVRAASAAGPANPGTVEKEKDQRVVRAELISELGIFGCALFGGGVSSLPVGLDGNRAGNVVEKEIGWLVRTKGKESNEGGVATGFSVLDSVVLVD
ncbi:Glutathione synthetase [Stygiomarasmius scandens]|uniref:Glutathione synthetase n=1 Tax=Marasmiellus scandens TaxID=2682957 RepID=A0ABR1IUB0_9AGAR